MLAEILWPLTAYHWLALGIALLVLETLGFAGFLIGASIAAIIVGGSMFVIDINWHEQLSLFAVLSVIFTVVYWRFFRSYNENVSDNEMLNNRAAQFVGNSYPLEIAIVNGYGKIKIGDTLWKVKSDVDMEVGSRVEVTGYEGMMLLVK
jgi:membrane protein implicated in regulation of membrane protease activity